MPRLGKQGGKVSQKGIYKFLQKRYNFFTLSNKNTTKGGKTMEGYAFEQKFKSIMVLNDDTIDKLSDYLQMARQTLSRKIANGTFDMEEMTKIKIRYNLSDEAYAQLFTKEVES